MAYNQYSDDQIRSFFSGKGADATNPFALWNYSGQYNADPAQVARVQLGATPDQVQRWQSENITPNGYAQAGGALHDPTTAQTDPQKAYALAMANGWTEGQADSSYGLGAGVAGNWAAQHGLTGFGGGSAPASSGAAPAAGGATTTAYPGGGQMTSYPAAQPQNPGLPPVGGGVGVGQYTPPGGLAMGGQFRGNMGWGGPQQAGGHYGPNDQWIPDAAGGQGSNFGNDPRMGGPSQWGGGQMGNQGVGGLLNYLFQNPSTLALGNEVTRGVTNNLQRTILPGIRRNAMVDGVSGGSGQGIAEGLAIGDSMSGLAGALAGLYGGQYEKDRQFGLQDTALDLGIYNANQGWMRQGQLDQINGMGQILNNNQQGLATAGQAAQTPFTNWSRFANAGAQLGGLGGTQTQNLQGNPLLGAIGGWAAGQKLFGG